MGKLKNNFLIFLCITNLLIDVKSYHVLRISHQQIPVSVGVVGSIRQLSLPFKQHDVMEELFSRIPRAISEFGLPFCNLQKNNNYKVDATNYFPNGIMKDHSFDCAFRVNENYNTKPKDSFNLININDMKNGNRFCMRLKPETKSIEVERTNDGETSKMEIPSPEVFDGDWHDIKYNLKNNDVSVFVDCNNKKVGKMVPVQAPNDYDKTPAEEKIDLTVVQSPVPKDVDIMKMKFNSLPIRAPHGIKCPELEIKEDPSKKPPSFAKPSYPPKSPNPNEQPQVPQVYEDYDDTQQQYQPVDEGFNPSDYSSTSPQNNPNSKPSSPANNPNNPNEPPPYLVPPQLQPDNIDNFNPSPQNSAPKGNNPSSNSKPNPGPNSKPKPNSSSYSNPSPSNTNNNPNYISNPNVIRNPNMFSNPNSNPNDAANQCMPVPTNIQCTNPDESCTCNISNDMVNSLKGSLLGELKKDLPDPSQCPAACTNLGLPGASSSQQPGIDINAIKSSITDDILAYVEMYIDVKLSFEFPQDDEPQKTDEKPAKQTQKY